MEPPFNPTQIARDLAVQTTSSPDNSIIFGVDECHVMELLDWKTYVFTIKISVKGIQAGALDRPSIRSCVRSWKENWLYT